MPRVNGVYISCRDIPGKNRPSQREILFREGYVALPEGYTQKYRKKTPDPTEEEILATLKNRHEVRKKLGLK